MRVVPLGDATTPLEKPEGYNSNPALQSPAAGSRSIGPGIRAMRTLGLAVTLAPLFCVAVWAQDAATIVGTVTDPSGGVMPGAQVTVSNPEKGFTRDLATNTAGEYTAARVPIGNYVVSGEKAGFQKLDQCSVNN